MPRITMDCLIRLSVWLTSGNSTQVIIGADESTFSYLSRAHDRNTYRHVQ